MNNNKKKKEAVVFDIDGTVSDRRHRLKHLDGKKDWDAFFNDMDQDPPIAPIVRKVEDYSKKKKQIIFVTGRPDSYRNITEEWIKRNIKINDYILIMRETNNYESDLSLKKRFLETELLEFHILKVFDDREDLISMWKEAGLDCVDCSSLTLES